MNGKKSVGLSIENSNKTRHLGDHHMAEYKVCKELRKAAITSAI